MYKSIYGPPQWFSNKKSACIAGIAGSVPGRGHGNPLQYSCLENPMDRGVWQDMALGSQKAGHSWSNWARTHKALYGSWSLQSIERKWEGRQGLLNSSGTHTHTKKKLLNLNLDICKYKDPLTPQPWGPFGFRYSPATTVHPAFLSVLLSLLLTLSLSSVLGILGLIFWNLSRKWGTWDKKIKCACLRYLLLPNKPPQNLAAKNKSHVIISILRVSWSPAEWRFHWFPVGHLTAAVRQRWG